MGYCRAVDLGALDAVGKRLGTRIRLASVPGSFVTPVRPLAHVGGAPSEADLETVRAAFVVGEERSLEQDVRFGFLLLSEVASRALSPAVNDPGTAIDVIGRGVRLLLRLVAGRGRAEAPCWPHVEAPDIGMDKLVDDLFSASARDGAPMLSVQVRRQKAMATLARLGDEGLAQAARAQSAAALARFRQGPATRAEKARAARLAREVAAGRPVDGL